jgi:hypothetical protein
MLRRLFGQEFSSATAADIAPLLIAVNRRRIAADAARLEARRVETVAARAIDILFERVVPLADDAVPRACDR